MANKDSVLIIQEANNTIQIFFGGDESYSSAFKELADFIFSLDSRIVLRFNKSIIGVSRLDSVYHFYVSRLNNHYYIKYKNRDKEEFKLEEMESYKEYCNDAVRFINGNDEYLLSKPYNLEQDIITEFHVPKENNPKKQIEENDFITRDNELLVEAQEYLLSHKDQLICEEIFGIRAYNALHRSGIKTYGNLIGKTASDFLKIRNLGRTNLKIICKELNDLIDEREPVVNVIEVEIPWCLIRKRTENLMSQEYVPINSDDKSREYALVFLHEFTKLIEDTLKSGLLIKEKYSYILYERIFNKRTLQDIGDEYSVSRERIRQICVKASRRIKSKIVNAQVSREFSISIENLINNIKDDSYFACLSYIRDKDPFIWELLSGILVDKNMRPKLNIILTNNESFYAPIKEVSNKNHIDDNIEHRKRYSEWQKENPDYVLLIKAGYFYSAYGKSAEVINKILGYKLVYTSRKNIAYTGGTNLEKIQNALKKADICYAVIIRREIQIRYEGQNKLSDVIIEDSEEQDLIQVIEALEQGVDPTTGEVLDSESFLFNESVQEILAIAKKFIKEKENFQEFKDVD